jgi:hypothetical protein
MDKQPQGQQPQMQTFETGAKRGGGVAGDEHSRFPLRFDLLIANLSFMNRMAAVYGEGAQKYTDDNWKKGIPEKSLMNHAMAHLIRHLSGDQTEDHLAHATWNFMALMWVQDNRPDLLDLCKSANFGVNMMPEMPVNTAAEVPRTMVDTLCVQIMELASKLPGHFQELANKALSNPASITDAEYDKMGRIVSDWNRKNEN